MLNHLLHLAGHGKFIIAMEDVNGFLSVYWTHSKDFSRAAKTQPTVEITVRYKIARVSLRMISTICIPSTRGSVVHFFPGIFGPQWTSKTDKPLSPPETTSGPAVQFFC